MKNNYEITYVHKQTKDLLHALKNRTGRNIIDIIHNLVLKEFEEMKSNKEFENAENSKSLKKTEPTETEILMFHKIKQYIKEDLNHSGILFDALDRYPFERLAGLNWHEIFKIYHEELLSTIYEKVPEHLEEKYTKVVNTAIRNAIEGFKPIAHFYQ